MNIENRWVFSRWRNVDNDSAVVTSEGRSFQVRAATTGKARLAAVDSHTVFCPVLLCFVALRVCRRFKVVPSYS